MNPGIYIHIPFCERKCGYCDFYSVVPHRNFNSLRRRLVRATSEEFALRRKHWLRSVKISTLYVGGGTPSLLSPDELAEMISALASHFDLSLLQEFTVEMNPGTVDREKLAAYRNLGINRLSIGVQAFQNRLLHRLQRIHTVEQATEVVQLARKTGFDNVNIDLIFGIPGQTREDWQESLNRVLALAPEHLSVYNLTYEEGTPFSYLLRSGTLAPMDEELEEELYLQAHELLTSAGYRHYEISNYALPGRECQHNLNYWNNGVYLGFGPSAHSYDGQQRWWNAPNLQKYFEALEQHQLPPGGSEHLSPEARLEEWLLLRMRQSSGISDEELVQRANISWSSFLATLKNRFGPRWRQFFYADNRKLSFTPAGFWYSDELLPEILKLLERTGGVSRGQ